MDERMQDLFKELAKCLKACYDALIETGFDEEHAMFFADRLLELIISGANEQVKETGAPIELNKLLF